LRADVVSVFAREVAVGSRGWAMVHVFPHSEAPARTDRERGVPLLAVRSAVAAGYRPEVRG